MAKFMLVKFSLMAEITDADTLREAALEKFDAADTTSDDHPDTADWHASEEGQEERRQIVAREMEALNQFVDPAMASGLLDGVPGVKTVILGTTVGELEGTTQQEARDTWANREGITWWPEARDAEAKRQGTTLCSAAETADWRRAVRRPGRPSYAVRRSAGRRGGRELREVALAEAEAGGQGFAGECSRGGTVADVARRRLVEEDQEVDVVFADVFDVVRVGARDEVHIPPGSSRTEVVCFLWPQGEYGPATDEVTVLAAACR